MRLAHHECKIAVATAVDVVAGVERADLVGAGGERGDARTGGRTVVEGDRHADGGVVDEELDLPVGVTVPLVTGLTFAVNVNASP